MSHTGISSKWLQIDNEFVKSQKPASNFLNFTSEIGTNITRYFINNQETSLLVPANQEKYQSHCNLIISGSILLLVFIHGIFSQSKKAVSKFFYFFILYNNFW